MNVFDAIVNALAAQNTTEYLQGRIYAVFLLSLRIAAILAMTPILYGVPGPARVRALLVLSLALAIASGFPDASQIQYRGAGPLIQSACTELALGATLALGIMLAFAAFTFVGQLLDLQLGFGIAQILDPVSNRPVPILVSAFNYLGILVFFLVDGHHAFLRGIAFSVEHFPVGAPWAMQNAMLPVVAQVAGLASLGFALAAPVVFCILLTELALGVVGRNLPQVNMLTFGIPVKIVVGLSVLALWVAMMSGSMLRVYSSIYKTWNGIFTASHMISTQSLVNQLASAKPAQARASTHPMGYDRIQGA